MQKKQFHVYILTNRRYGTLYTGMTSDLMKRLWQHKHGEADGFTKKYKVKQLVYYEPHENSGSAIRREKQIKEWKRYWKIELVEKQNPHWYDLYDYIAKNVNR